MNILAVDTALGACSVAVFAGETILAHRFESMERGHAEAIAPMVEQTMKESGLPFAALDRLGVTIGPGSFTGMRVGLAFMRGLRLALSRPLLGVTTLSAMAHQAMAETGLSLSACVHQARRGEVYFESCSRNELGSTPSLLPLSEAASRIDEISGDSSVALAGSMQEQARELLRNKRGQSVSTGVIVPDALFVARLCLAMTPSNDVPRPLYLHPYEARLQGPIK
jgi:tRNA threonylcarbamoyladenosine biosynthesis protein TsaB